MFETTIETSLIYIVGCTFWALTQPDQLKAEKVNWNGLSVRINVEGKR